MRVLVIETNPGLRALFARELEEAGVAASGVATWEEGLRAAREARPDAVLLDATLSPGTGAWFVREVRADPGLGALPLVGVAFAPGRDRELLDAGVDCCLRTLPTRGEVWKAVQWALDVYRDRRGDPGRTDSPPPPPHVVAGITR